MSVAVSQRLQELRRRLAASENLEVITDVRRAARRFAERTDLREAFAMLVAGCDEKRRRIRAASATQRQALAAGCAFTMSPGIEMKIGAWRLMNLAIGPASSGTPRTGDAAMRSKAETFRGPRTTPSILRRQLAEFVSGSARHVSDHATAARVLYQ